MELETSVQVMSQEALCGVEYPGIVAKAKLICSRTGAELADAIGEIQVAIIEINGTQPDVVAKGPAYLLTTAYWNTLTKMQRKGYTDAGAFELDGVENGDEFILSDGEPASEYTALDRQLDIMLMFQSIRELLTDRDVAICTELALGGTTRTIASKVGVSPMTISRRIGAIRGMLEGAGYVAI